MCVNAYRLQITCTTAWIPFPGSTTTATTWVRRNLSKGRLIVFLIDIHSESDTLQFRGRYSCPLLDLDSMLPLQCRVIIRVGRSRFFRLPGYVVLHLPLPRRHERRTDDVSLLRGRVPLNSAAAIIMNT